MAFFFCGRPMRDIELERKGAGTALSTWLENERTEDQYFLSMLTMQSLSTAASVKSLSIFSTAQLVARADHLGKSKLILHLPHLAAAPALALRCSSSSFAFSACCCCCRAAS